MNLDRVLEAAAPFETPLAVVDVEVMERNLECMATIARAAGARLRPHAKTHKSPRVARRQLARGATGLTVATLKEAEVFADAGVDDLLIAHPPAGEGKLRRLAELAGRVKRLAVSLDDTELGSRLPSEVEVLWEVDTGLGRVGTQPGAPTAKAVARLIDHIGPGRVRGLLTHAGHAYRAVQPDARREVAQAEIGGLLESAQALRSLGIDVRELSVGSTPTAEFAPQLAGITEMRPGTYVYGDANQVTLGSQRLADCALAVIATVVSTPAADRAVIDAGSKAISADRLVPVLQGYGLILGRPALRLERLSEEHGVLLSDAPTDMRVGERVAVLPAHVCTTVNLHPQVLMTDLKGRGDWDPVAARGWR